MFNLFNNDESEEEEEDPDPYECRLYHPFERVVEEFQFLDGSTRTLEYDRGVVNHRRVSVEDDSIWRIQNDTEFAYQSFSFGDSKELPVKMEMIGKLRRGSVPVVERLETEKLVVFIESTKTINRHDVGDNRIHVVPRDEFEVRSEDEKVQVRVDL